MSELTADNAAEALRDAWREDGEDSYIGEKSTPSTAQDGPSEEHVPSNQPTPPAEEKPSGLFYDVDPNTLTPELRQMFDGMNKAFTEKNQSLAEERRAYESLGGFDRVQEAVGFVESLQNPENLVRLHSELSDYLQEAGFSKAQADEAAGAAIQEQQGGAQQEEDYGFADPEVANLRREIDGLNSWKSSFEEQQELARTESAIERTELALRESRGYNDTDVSRIYELAYSHGADLIAAADAYDSWKTDILSGYINQKAEAPTGATSATSSALGQVPESFGSDFEAAHKHAKAIITAAQRAGEFDGDNF